MGLKKKNKTIRVPEKFFEDLRSDIKVRRDNKLTRNENLQEALRLMMETPEYPLIRTKIRFKPFRKKR